MTNSLHLVTVLALLTPAPDGNSDVAPVIATFRAHKHTITCLDFAPDGTSLASGSKDGVVILWNVATGKARATLPGHRDMVTAIAFTPDGKTLASASHDSLIRLWDAATGRPMGALHGHEKDVRGLAFARTAGRSPPAASIKRCVYGPGRTAARSGSVPGTRRK